MRVLLILLLTAACASERDMASRFGGGAQPVHHARVAVGDDPRWADPRFDDSRWPEHLLYPPPLAKTLWLRAPIDVPDLGDGRAVGLYVAMVGSFEAYVDGRRVGASGTIARDGSAGAPGPLDNFFVLDVPPGRHLLAVRVAPGRDAARTYSYFQGIAVGHYAHMTRSRVASQLVPAAGFGVFAVVGLYYLSIWFARAPRRPPILVFSLLCFAASLLVLVETSRWLVGYTYDWQVPRLHAVAALTFVVSFLLPLFFVLELGLARARWWAGALLLALVTIFLFGGSSDDTCLLMFWVAMIASALAIVVAARRRKWEVLPSAIAVALLGAALPAGGYGFSDQSFFIAFCGVIVCLLVSMALQQRRQRREHESALLRAARLEIELLKKSIQPHFLMNTLTAVMEWIEENPAEGVQFLEALAEELRIFAEVSGDALIPIERELALCRSHLQIMSCRKGTRFALDAEVDRDGVVPPAIFHTLVENAITHNRYSDDVVFTLREERENGMRRYVFDAPFVDAGHAARAEGMGLRYIKARLEESFPGRWSLDAGPRASAWRTTIEVRT